MSNETKVLDHLDNAIENFKVCYMLKNTVSSLQTIRHSLHPQNKNNHLYIIGKLGNKIDAFRTGLNLREKESYNKFKSYETKERNILELIDHITIKSDNPTKSLIRSVKDITALLNKKLLRCRESSNLIYIQEIQNLKIIRTDFELIVDIIKNME